MKVGDLASSVGKGLFAGATGTAAMTVSSTPETKARDRAAGKVLGVEPKDEAGEARFATLVHWGYGTGWGAVRGLIATAVRFGAMGAAQALLNR